MQETYITEDAYWEHNGVLHREDGPAVIWSDGTQFWYHHGKRHREDGPAVIRSDGTKVWWVNGNNITTEVNN